MAQSKTYLNIMIRDMQNWHNQRKTQAAEILQQAFAEHWPDAWPTHQDALETVYEMLARDRICRVALVDGMVVGWIGGIPEYDGRVWELHPLAVHPDWQGRGIGQALVADLELQVAERGGLTIMIGSDDEDDMTSLAGVDIYDGLLRRLETIENRKGHPYSFYQKCGFVICGVIPDANGYGKPDILMSKRVTRTGSTA